MINFAGELPPEWQPKLDRLRLDGKIKLNPREEVEIPGSKLQRKFDEKVHEPELKALLPIIEGLTRLLPSDRISASQALDMIKDICIDDP